MGKLFFPKRLSDNNSESLVFGSSMKPELTKTAFFAYCRISCKLAASNLRKNAKVNLPFNLICVIIIAMFYIICALAQNSGLKEMNNSVSIMLELASQVAAVFAVIFLLYTHSFLMKQRKMELGLYNVLGMDKKHIALTITWETLLIAAVSLLLGLAAGILLDKVMYLTLLKIIGLKVSLGFEISFSAILTVIILFSVIFALILLGSLLQIFFSKPVELLKGGQVGEKEPKTKWLMALLGILSLGSGYTIAIVSENPVEAINMFFVAVILVMIGTYLIFVAGSIALLKLLRNNKRYYYKTKRFISISGMIYRMKQNAAGLGSICILSTAVLVMISTTMSLYIGMEDVLKTRYPQNITLGVSADNEKQLNLFVDDVLSHNGLSPQNAVSFSYLCFAVIENEDEFITEPDSMSIKNLSSIRNLVFIPLEDYNAMSVQPQMLSENEVLIYTNRGVFNYNTLRILDETFSVKETLVDVPCGDIIASDIITSHYIIAPNIEIIERFRQTFSNIITDEWRDTQVSYRYAFDIDADSETIINIFTQIKSKLKESGMISSYSAECRETERSLFLEIYGGLLFVGIFLGILFTMATVLIIYYKQITEGYGDKARFVIMKKVGLSSTEIKKTIHSQILIVFFLPIVTAGIHIAAAFPSLTRILATLNLTNVPLFLVCTVICYAVFTVFYIIVYSLTARTYYRIVG